MLKLAFIGPESSGKTTLSMLATEKFDGTYIEEVSRAYLAQTKGIYTYDDLEKIAALQFQAINQTLSPLTFIDTDLIDMKVWSLFKYKQCAPYIQQHIPLQKIDFYFLCKPDFPWQADPLRENPSDENRATLYQLFKDVLTEFNLPFIELKGSINERMTTIEVFIKKLKNEVND